MQIVAASAADANTFAELNRHVHSIHLENAPSFFREPTLEEAAAAFRRLLSKEDARAYLALLDGEAVGYLLLFLREREAHAFCPARRFLYVEQISVEPAWQGHGVGRALMDAALQFAVESGIDDIETDTWAFNSQAQTFFQAVGFAPKTYHYQMKLSSQKNSADDF